MFAIKLLVSAISPLSRSLNHRLLKKQKVGKKRIRMVGKVEIPQEAILSVIKVQ